MLIPITLHPFRATCASELPPIIKDFSSLSFDLGTETILSERECGCLIYRTVELDYGGKTFKMLKVFNSDGHYVGDERWGKMLTERGIVPELARPDQGVCSVGFCEKEQKWYGWSHRSMCGFGIGDRIFEVGYGDADTLFTEHGKVRIKSLDQARQAAVNFADYVS